MPEPQYESMVDHAMVTTTFTLDGYRVVRNLGLVRGIIVRSRSVFGTIGASLQTLVGGDITLFTNCARRRASMLSTGCWSMPARWAPNA